MTPNLITAIGRKMPSQKDDLAYGETNEVKVLDALNTAFNASLERFGGYSTMDYANPARTLWVELKSRRINHNQYPTALIGANKVAFCNEEGKEYYFVFKYLDGLYYIKYDAETFKGFKTDTNYQRGAREDCYNYAQSIVHIPVEHLQPLPATLMV